MKQKIQKEITCSDDIITSSDGTVLIQKTKSSKTKADKTESYTSFQPVDIKKFRSIKNFWIIFSRFV